ncbi:MAG: hypothetical protein ACKVHP_02930 [Verrucomicrobiales bacterium]
MELGEELIATVPSQKAILGPKGSADALRSVVSAMDGVMAPPGAAIVPKMMVLVVSKEPDGESVVVARGRRGWVWHDGMTERFVLRLV